MKVCSGLIRNVISKSTVLFASVVLAGLTAQVNAQQHVFAPVGPTGALGTTWQGPNADAPFLLGNAPTGTWTSAFIAIDWSGSSPAADQWGSEARTALHSQAWDQFFNPPGAGTSPTGSGTVFWSAPGAATSSANSIAAQPNVYWSVANLTNSINSNGSQAVYLSSRQTFAGGGASASHANIRVVLNPNIIGSSLGTGLSVPGAFTDLGTFAVGGTSHDVVINNTDTGSAGFTWLRFQVDRDVTGADAFDMFSSIAAGGDVDTDTRVSLFRNTANGLFAVASTDDIGGGNFNGGLTFGSSDAAAFGRDQYGVPGNGPTFFNGRGGTLGIAALNPFGYYSGTAGAAQLFAGEEYFVAISDWQGTNPFVTNSGLEITNDHVSLGSLNMGLNGPIAALGNGNIVFSFRSVPEPSSFAIIALAGATLLVGRRRR